MTKDHLLLRAARGEHVEKVPVWVMRQAGRYLPEFRAVRAKHDFFTICRTPELACEVTLQPIDRYEGLLDAAIIFCDILVVPQALGLQVEMVEGSGPHFPNPIRTLEDLKRVKETVDVDKELGYVYEAISLTRKNLRERVPLFGFAGAPWTLFAYMIEGGGSKTFSRAKSWLYKYPKESHWLLQRTTDVVVDFLVGQVKAGAQILQVFDSWAGELSPEYFRKFSLPYLTQIVTRVKMELSKDPNVQVVPMVVFAKGAHASLDVLSSIGYDVVSLDWTIDPRDARAETKNRVTLQGNADPCLLYAPHDVIRSHVKDMVEKFGKRQYIANLGHGMHPDHDPEALRVYLQAIKDETLQQ